MADVNEKVLDGAGLATLWERIGEKFGKMAVGTYKGTGTYGSNNPNKLTFDFVPQIVIVKQKRVYSNSELPSINTHPFKNMFIAINGDVTQQVAVTMYKTLNASSGSTAYTDFIWNGKTFSWYSEESNTNLTAIDQFNYSGREYEYIAFGM